MPQDRRSLVVVGAGPIGLETALEARSRGLDVTVVEKGRVGENVRAWGFVRLFSPWKLDASPLGRRTLLEEGAWGVPPDPETFPTGDELVERYLVPLARSRVLRGRVLERTRVVAIGREGLLKGEAIGTPARASRPFRILVEDERGAERVLDADAVIDASGTYGQPNALGEGGIPATGERALAHRIRYTLADVTGSDRPRYAGRRTLVIGHGFSAATALRALVELSEEEPATRVVWAHRSERREPFDVILGDSLRARAELASLGNRIARGGARSVDVVAGATVEALDARSSDSLRVTLRRTGAATREIEVDEILALVGYRPDLSLHRELQVHHCYASEGPMKLAAALLQAASADGSADCLAQTSHGGEALRSPEPDFFVLGAKSYGRHSNFLLRIGFEQVNEALDLFAPVPQEARR
jgi:thioredoxin reductase